MLTRKCPLYLHDSKQFSDPADVIQKDSPYYEVVDNKKDRRDYEKTHSVVKKHHISQIDKEGKGEL